MAVALAHMQQAIEVALAAGHGGGGQPAVVGRAVAGLQARADILAGLDDVVRVQGEVAHRTADGIAAVQHRGRAAEDFHALDDLGVDVVALGLGVGAVEEAVRDRHTVDLGQHALTVDATDVVTVQAAALAGATDRHAWLIAHQFLDVIDVLPVQLLACLHTHGARHLADVLGAAGGADGHLLQGDGIACRLALEHYIAVADLAIAQAGTLQQLFQCRFRRQRAADTWRSHTVGQFGAEAHLPAGHLAEGVDGLDQGLLGDAEAVVAHARACRVRRFCSQRWQAAGATGEQGQGQQGQLAGTAGKGGRASWTCGHRKRSLTRELL
ncbi:hypothetical protein D3C78_704610 [compost metagenome]